MDKNKIKINVVGRIRRIKDARYLKAFADICLNNEIVVKNLRVINGKTGLFVSMPQHLNKNGRWYDTVYCTTASIRQEIKKRVLAAYEKEKIKV